MKQKKEENKNKKIILYVLGIMALLIIGLFIVGKIMKPEDKNKYPYNGYLFVKHNNFWYTEGKIISQGKILPFLLETRFGPKELEYISVDRRLMEFFKDENNKSIEAVYLTFDPKQNDSTYQVLAASELNKIRAIGVNILPACTTNETSEVCKELPVITCESPYPVIYLKESSFEKISYLAHRCVVVEGKDMGLVKSAERLIFQWFNVYENN